MVSDTESYFIRDQRERNKLTLWTTAPQFQLTFPSFQDIFGTVFWVVYVDSGFLSL